MKGDLRKKTRPQGQDERVFRQDRFDGGQNSDTVAKKIATNEVALLVNAVGYEDAIEGGWGARLASDERYPGSGKVWDIQQHKVSGRWLLHRGNELWLSAGRKQAEWVRVAAKDTDKAMSSELGLTNGLVVLSGSLTFLQNMVLSGVSPGQEIKIGMASSSSPVVVFIYDLDDVILATGSINFSDTPGTITLNEVGGSGVSGTVYISAGSYPSGQSGTGRVISVTLYANDFLGLTENNTIDYRLSVEVDTYTMGNPTVTFYRSGSVVAFATLVGTGSIQSEAGITGGATLFGDRNTVEDVYSGDIEFEFQDPDISGRSEIASFRDGFLVSVSGDSNRTIFVDTASVSYWFLSAENGYGKYPIPVSGALPFKYRYVYTYCRILNSAGLPDGSLNRTTGNLAFEGPSPKVANGGIDYGQRTSSAAISPTNAMTVPFISIVANQKITASAASYITSLGLYRTLNTSDAATNPEQYVWVADIPIGSVSYSDTTTDETLLARLQANIDAPIYRLQSRGFVPMDRGIVGLRDDFMFTSAPNSTSVSYCELSYAPRLIGYHNALQRIKINDPVTHIQTTPESAIVLCPSSAHQITPSIFQDVGRGLSFLPIISSQYRVSGNVGVSINNRPFVIDASSFIAFCTDRTIRVFSGSSWGKPLDDMLVHGILEGVENAVIGYVHGVVLVWIEGMCLRYAFGGDPGSRWSEIVREHWPAADVASMWEDDDSSIRLSVSAGDIPYVVEDEHGRVYEDEVPGSAPAIRGTSAIKNLSIDGWSGVTLYGAFRHGMIGFFESSSDRDLWQNLVGYTSEVSEPAPGILIGGAMSGSLDVTSLDIGDFTVVDGIGVVERARIDSKIKFRDLAATQDSFRCFHKSSYASVLFPYIASTPKFLATWYGDGVAKDSSVVVPSNGSIQSFKRIEGNRIQLELEIQGSGWQLDSIETRYQTHDVRLASGPYGGPEASYQAEIAQNMLAWLRGDSGLRNRVGGVFVGDAPVIASDPRGGMDAQEFVGPVDFMASKSITEFTLMFWAKSPITGADPNTSAPVVVYSAGVPFAFLGFVAPSVVSFSYGDVPGSNVFVSGPASDFISRLILGGVTPGQVVEIDVFEHDVDNVRMEILIDGLLVALSEIEISSQPADNVEVSEIGGSGISGTVSISGYTSGSFSGSGLITSYDAPESLPASSDDGEWHHYALTRDGDKFCLFQDGVKFAEMPLAFGPAVPVDEIRVGCEAGSQMLYDPRFYYSRLSDEAIAYYFANGEK